jgi:hypothetical protein
MTLSIQPKEAEIQATLETRHCTVRAFGRNTVEAYMTLYYAWQQYAKQSTASPNLINVYRYAISYTSIPRNRLAPGTAFVDNELFVTNALDNFPPVLYHVNRRGQIYFLHRVGTKEGIPQFTFSMDLSGDLVNELPPDHEVYEAPNAMVFVRPVVRSLITREEQTTIERLLQAHFRQESYKAELKKRSIVVHMASDLDVDRLLEHDLSEERLQYRVAFKFDLVTKKTGIRKFVIRLSRSYDNKWIEYAQIHDLRTEAVAVISELAVRIKQGILYDLNDAIFDPDSSECLPLKQPDRVTIQLAKTEQ